MSTTTTTTHVSDELKNDTTSTATATARNGGSEGGGVEMTPTPTITEGNTASKEKGLSRVPSESHDTEDVIIVNWEGPDDPENPKNWAYKRKWAATAIVSMFTFISPVSSSMVAPATDQIASQFGITSSVVIAMTTSIFVLAYAIGPLILGPLSEIYGRSRVLQLANLFYLVWNLVCGFAQTETQLIIFRLLAGLGGSAPLSIGGGVLGDVWHAEERGKAIAVYSLAPLMGPVVGPIAGAWIAERSTWRWVFWSTSIVDAAIQVAGVFFLQETFAPLLLERKANLIRKNLSSNSDNSDLEKGPATSGKVREVRTVFGSQERTWQAIFSKALTRPFVLFVREPIAQVVGVYMAFVYGVFYLYLTTIPTIFDTVYHESTGIGGLNYIALGVGLTLSSQINARYMDKIYVYLKERRGGGVGKPEFRVPSMALGSLALPIGLFLSGWAAQEDVHWVVTDIGMAFVGMGVILTFQSMQTYVVDCFTLHAASALAAVSCLRSLAGFGFPLFAPSMYNALGFGKGDTILAAVSIAIGWPAPIVFWKYGEGIRMRSKYAHKSAAVGGK